MNSVIVSDTSSLIILSRLDKLELLKNLFEKVIIPTAVYDEIKERFLKTDFIERQNPKDTKLLSFIGQFLDAGESAAITLAKEQNLPLLIDEIKGRKISKMVGVKVFGLVGFLLLCVQSRMLKPQEAKELLESAKDFGFRVGESLEREFLSALGKMLCVQPD